MLIHNEAFLEFDKVIACLALQLPESVYNDVALKYSNLKLTICKLETEPKKELLCPACRLPMGVLYGDPTIHVSCKHCKEKYTPMYITGFNDALDERGCFRKDSEYNIQEVFNAIKIINKQALLAKDKEVDDFDYGLIVQLSSISQNILYHLCRGNINERPKPREGLTLNEGLRPNHKQ